MINDAFFLSNCFQMCIDDFTFQQMASYVFNNQYSHPGFTANMCALSECCKVDFSLNVPALYGITALLNL